MPAARLRRLALALALCAAAAPRPAAAEGLRLADVLHPATDRGYFPPLLADPRAAISRVAFPAWSKAVPFAVDPGAGMVWDITMGRELPLLALQPDTLTTGWFEPGHWGAGLWLPIGFHMMEDLGKDTSNPILNVDYRFGLMLKAQVGLPRPPGQDTHAALGAQVYVGHESTHLGDEFTLNALEAHPATFQRVNVSYQFVEPGLQLALQWAGATARLQLRTLFVAFTSGDSWYGEKLEYGTPATVVATRRNFEPSLGVEVGAEWPGWLFLSRPFVSVDLRPRTVYDYQRTDPADGEGFRWSVNALVGVRPAARGWGGLSHVYLRGYRGVNPAGQFRSQAEYWLVGLGLAFFHEDT